MEELTITEMSDDELLQLLAQSNPNSLVNNSEEENVIDITQASDEQILSLLNQKNTEKDLENLRAENPLEYFKNSAKLGLGDSAAFAALL